LTGLKNDPTARNLSKKNLKCKGSMGIVGTLNIPLHNRPTIVLTAYLGVDKKESGEYAPAVRRPAEVIKGIR